MNIPERVKRLREEIVAEPVSKATAKTALKKR